MDYTLSELYHLLTDPEAIINTGGLILILVIIFAENGLFFGFFLPGDTLLFSAGLFCGTDTFHISIYVLLVTICLAAYGGSMFGYYFGQKTGARFFQKDESVFFKRKYVYAAEAFFNRYGGMALILGRFLPVIRTFAPIFAGMISFDYQKYMINNIIGGTLWVCSMTLGGFIVGSVVPNAKDHLASIITLIVIITWIPVIITYIREMRNQKRKLKGLS